MGIYGKPPYDSEINSTEMRKHSEPLYEISEYCIERYVALRDFPSGDCGVKAISSDKSVSSWPDRIFGYYCGEVPGDKNTANNEKGFSESMGIWGREMSIIY